MRALTHPLLTPRLRLEPVTPVLAAAAREGGQAFAAKIGAEAPPEWCEASLALVARSASGGWGAAAAPIRAVAIHRQDGCVIGDVRFEPTPFAPDQVEIGYGVTRSRRRQGYAVEAAGAVIEWLFNEADATLIIAGCDMKNVASVRVLRRLGFWLDGAAGRRAFWWRLSPP